jgi:hypothetical protein
MLRRLNGHLSQVAQRTDATALVFETPDGWVLEGEEQEPIAIGRTFRDAKTALLARNRAREARRSP